MKRILLVCILVAVCIAVAVIAAAWVYTQNPPTSEQEKQFTLTSQSDNITLLSDADVVSFNQTSQEFTLTDAAAQRLANQGDNLYLFSNVFVFTVNGEEVYQGIFRSVIMSALPEPPKIAILYPSFDYSTNLENDHAIRLFYPTFEVPSDLSEMNTKLTQYFQDAGKLVN